MLNVDSLYLAVYLASELQAAQIVHSKPVKHVDHELKDSPAGDIQLICKTLQISHQDTLQNVFSITEEKVMSAFGCQCYVSWE